MGRLVLGVVIVFIHYSPAILECPALSLNTLFYVYCNYIGHQGRIMRDMQVIAQQHLQRMLAGWQGNFGRRAAIAEMNMILIFGDWHPKIRNLGIDEQVVVAGMRRVLARRSNGHSLDSEDDTDGIADRLAISRVHKEHDCICR